MKTTHSAWILHENYTQNCDVTRTLGTTNRYNITSKHLHVTETMSMLAIRPASVLSLKPLTVHVLFVLCCLEILHYYMNKREICVEFQLKIIFRLALISESLEEHWAIQAVITVELIIRKIIYKRHSFIKFLVYKTNSITNIL